MPIARGRLPLLVSAALLITAGTTLAVGDRVFNWFSVDPSPEQAPTLPDGAPYVAGSSFYRAGAKLQHLAQPLLAPLLGQDAALAVLSPDQRYLAYHSARSKGDLTLTPLLYIHDSTNGRDRLLERGAQTIAWNRDGRIAYFRATRARYDGRHGAYVGHVLVGTTADGATAWTKVAGGYQVLAWARDRLLVSVRRCVFPNCRRDPEPGVYVLKRSGRLRPLQLATVAAVSPDGRYVFGRYDAVAGQDSPSPFVRIVDVGTGKRVATADLTQPARRAGLRGLLPGSIGAGAWRRDRIVVTFGGRDSAVVFLRMRARRLDVESVARIAPQTLRTRYGAAFGAPYFTSATNVVVPIRGERLNGRNAVAVAACSRLTRRCELGPVLSARRWFAIADNRSRPERG